MCEVPSSSSCSPPACGRSLWGPQTWRQAENKCVCGHFQGLQTHWELRPQKYPPSEIQACAGLGPSVAEGVCPTPLSPWWLWATPGTPWPPVSASVFTRPSCLHPSFLLLIRASGTGFGAILTRGDLILAAPAKTISKQGHVLRL